ncbi:MAG: MIP/aquaporin family protein [Actinomycetota bacterium]
MATSAETYDTTPPTAYDTTPPTGKEGLLEVAEVQAPLARRLGAEFLGTLLLVAIGTGAATAYLRGPIVLSEQLPDALRQVPEQLAIFNALLSVSLSDLVPVAIAFAFTLAFIVYAFGGVSGGHFNPAVTFGLAVSRRFPFAEAPLYMLAQVLGGIAGAFIVAGIFNETGAIVGDQQILFGAPRVADGVEFWQATLAETLITFGLMMAIMAVAVDRRAPKGWSGLVIGMALGAGLLATGPISGGSANFARTLGPYVAALPFDGVKVPWGDLLVYAVGPLVGATAAVFTYESISGMERVAPAPSPGAATHGEEIIDVSAGAETTATAPREDPRTP